MKLPTNRLVLRVHNILFVKQTRKRLALNRSHFAAFEFSAGVLHASQFHRCWSNIHHSQQLIVDRPRAFHTWTVNQSRNSNPAFGREPFPHFVRSRASLSPVAAFRDERTLAAIVLKAIVALLADEICKRHLR